MKKFFAILLAMMLVLSMSAVAFAATDPNAGKTDGFTDETTVYVTKNFKLANASTTSPAASFTLVQVGNGVVTDGDATSAPALGTITGVTYAAGDATVEGNKKDIAITLPSYEKVGKYEYTLQEVKTDNNLAGITYFNGTIKLVVTVINGANGNLRVAAVHTEGEAAEGETKPAKSDVFDNTYSAGSLAVSKTVTGNMGDKTKYFKVTVTLTGETGKTYATNYSVTGGSYAENPSVIVVGTATDFYLKHGETITIANLPYNVTYTVVEADYTKDTEGKKDYDAAVYAFSDETHTINSASDTVGITNNKGVNVDTGISTDSLPYIVLLGVVLLLGAAMLIKRRAYND